MRKANIILLLVLVVAAGCAHRQVVEPTVNKGMHVTRALILETVKMTETAYREGVIDPAEYRSFKDEVMVVVHRYNVLIRLGTQPSPADLAIIVGDLENVARRIKEARR